MAEISIDVIQKGISKAIENEFGDNILIHTNPLQQGFEKPCFFVLCRPSNITKIIGRFLYELKFDIVYCDNFNIVDLYDAYGKTAGRLDQIFEMFPIVGETCNDVLLIRAYNRNWYIALDSLHYQFDTKLLVSTEPLKAPDKMQTVKQLCLKIKGKVI